MKLINWKLYKIYTEHGGLKNYEKNVAMQAISKVLDEYPSAALRLQRLKEKRKQNYYLLLYVKKHNTGIKDMITLEFFFY